jgi:hypothetical protein
MDVRVVGMKRAKVLAVGALSLVFGWFVFAPVAQAADPKPLNLITSPLPINLQVDPGHTVTTDIKVKQNGGNDEILKVGLMKFAAYGTEGKPRLLDRAPGDDYFDWVKFDKTTFDAPNNVWVTVHMTISVPKTAAFGYYYAVVFSRQGDDSKQTGNTNSIAGGSAVLVLLDANVPGAKRQVSIDSITSLHNVYEFLPATFNVALRNTGNVHVVPHGNIFIMKGKQQIAVLDLNDQQGNTLPNSRRIYPVEWDDGFPHFEKVVQDGKVKLDKNNQPEMKLVWGDAGSGSKIFKPHIRMGKYTAHLVAVYDDGTRDVPIEAEVSFWVIPWKFFIALIAGLIILFLLIRFGLRLYRKRIMAQMRAK